MRQLTSLDAQFLAVESPRLTGHVSGLAVYDPSTAPGGELTLDRVSELIEQRLHLLPPFQWRLVEVPLGLGHPYWIEDPDFDLEYHLRELALPAPGDDAQLAEQVARIHSRPLDRSRPLWELYLIHGLPEGRMAMLTKVHHAAIDGVSGAELLGLLLDTSPDGREIAAPTSVPRPEQPPGQMELLGRTLARAPLQPWRMLRQLPTAIAHMPAVPGFQSLPAAGTLTRVSDLAHRMATRNRDGRILERPHLKAPRVSFNGKLSPHRRFAFGTLSLSRVKAIKNELGITVNDVVVALTATAVRDYLIEHDELPVEPLLAMVPVSVRTKEQQGKFGNAVSAMVVPIPTNEPDPRKRLLAAHEVMRGAKERHRATPASLMSDMTEFIPPAIAARAARVVVGLAGNERVRPPMNVIISNVPGPPVPLYCAGARLEAQYPVSAILDGVGLNVTVLSYRDRLDFGLVADREQTPDLWRMIDLLGNALDEMSELLPSGNGAAAKKPAATRKPAAKKKQQAAQAK